MPDEPTTDTSDATKDLPNTSSRLTALEDKVKGIERVLFGDEKTEYEGLQKRVKDLKEGKISKALTWSKITAGIVTIYFIIEIFKFFYSL